VTTQQSAGEPIGPCEYLSAAHAAQGIGDHASAAAGYREAAEVARVIASVPGRPGGAHWQRWTLIAELRERWAAREQLEADHAAAGQ